MLKALFQSGLLLLLFSSAGSAADVSGTWTLKMKGLDGDEQMDIVIKVSGEKLKITATHPMFDEMSGSGRLKGNAIKFKLNAEEMPMSIDFTGTVTGNKMSGIRVIQSGGGPGDFDGPDGPGGPGPGGPGDMGTQMNKLPKEWTAEKLEPAALK
jgi:hypothetical protein